MIVSSKTSTKDSNYAASFDPDNHNAVLLGRRDRAITWFATTGLILFNVIQWACLISCPPIPYHLSIIYQLPIPVSIFSTLCPPRAKNARNVIIESESHIFILNQSMSNASFILFVKGYYQSYDFSKLYLSFHF